MADRTLQKGEALFVQGEQPQSLFMLKQGSLEILSASSEFEGLDAGIILEKSNRVHLISGKGIMAGYSQMLTGPYKVSARASEVSIVTEVPLKQGGFKAIAAGDLGQSINILRQVYNRLNGVISDAGRFLKLYSTLASMSDNLSLLYSELSQGNVSKEMHNSAEELYNQFKAKGGTIPQSIDASLLIKDMGSLLGKTYSFNGPPLESLYNKDMYAFLKRLLMLDANILGAVLKKDPVITLHMFSCLTDCYTSVLGRISELYSGINEAAEKIFGNENSWTTHLTDDKGFGDWINSGRVNESFIKNLLSLVVKLNGVYEGISGVKITETYPGIKKIHEYLSSSSSAQETAASQSFVEPNMADSSGASPSSGASASVLAPMKRSLSQIFEFSMMDKEFQTQFVEELNKFKALKNPFNTESDGRKLRRRITKLYWDLYKQAYIRSKSEPTVPRPVKLMLNYGFLDETLIEESQLVELNELARMREGNLTYPILNEPEFLNLIYEDKLDPSITEMGLNYAGYLRELEKSARSKKGVQQDSSAPDNIKKTMYEVEQRLASTAAVCSGSTATAFPILTSLAVNGSLKSIHTSKSKVQQIVDDLRKIDFSVFYREVVLKLGDAREIVQTEVLPYFDILPIFGTRTLLWQELSGTNKRSRGRIVIPAFFLGDLSKSIAHTLASFRWELTRTMKGAQWADPIEGGVTGEYFDYVNTYKKNSKLSSEAKEKIKEKFRSLRTNRDRFADDYMSWIFYEKDGIMKLNTVVREMFYKHIPFPAELRDKLGNMPAFSHAANRYKNISARESQNYLRRYKKYQDENEEYPEDIKKFLEFLKL